MLFVLQACVGTTTVKEEPEQPTEWSQQAKVSIKKGHKKIIKRNAKAYDRFSDHIGFLPLVIISPADRDLITEGSDMRRKFIDGVISQSDKIYLENLIQTAG